MEWIMNIFIQLLLTILLTRHAVTEDTQCSRIQSRIAQSILAKSVKKIMTEEGLEFGSECALRPDRNMYDDNEHHKWSEVSNNWNCHYCGKSFFSEKFLDQHFENRHEDKILRGPQAVCLADHCDYLRCDVISSTKQSSFWEEALCRHKELEALKKKCQNIMKQCIPSHLSAVEKYELQDKLEASVCSFLTCEKYWENPFLESSPERVAAYIIASIFTVFGFIMYYTMACSHLYSESDSLLGSSDGLLRRERKMKDESRYMTYPPAYGQSIRSRPGVVDGR